MSINFKRLPQAITLQHDIDYVLVLHYQEK